MSVTVRIDDTTHRQAREIGDRLGQTIGEVLAAGLVALREERQPRDQVADLLIQTGQELRRRS